MTPHWGIQIAILGIQIATSSPVSSKIQLHKKNRTYDKIRNIIAAETFSCFRSSDFETCRNLKSLEAWLLPQTFVEGRASVIARKDLQFVSVCTVMLNSDGPCSITSSHSHRMRRLAITLIEHTRKAELYAKPKKRSSKQPVDILPLPKAARGKECAPKKKIIARAHLRAPISRRAQVARPGNGPPIRIWRARVWARVRAPRPQMSKALDIPHNQAQAFGHPAVSCRKSQPCRVP